jgi:hypothetical protein
MSTIGVHQVQLLFACTVQAPASTGIAKHLNSFPSVVFLATHSCVSIVLAALLGVFVSYLLCLHW